MRIVFMGTPHFAVPALNRLADDGHEIVAVYTQPPRPAGRGKKLRPSPVADAASAMGLDIRTPIDFKSESDCMSFEALDADVAIVVAYGLILPRRILGAPRLGCVNIHASLLPRWRGAAPIHRAIMSGDQETGVSIMQMEAGLDTGPVLLARSEPIRPDDTTQSLHDRLAQLGAAAISQTLQEIDHLRPVAQNDALASYAQKIDKAEAKINWSAPAGEVDQKIRGLSPFPGAWFDYQSERIKVLNSSIVSGSGTPGCVIASPLVVACTTGAVSLDLLQRAGKRPISASEFLRGLSVRIGADLGS